MEWTEQEVTGLSDRRERADFFDEEDTIDLDRLVHGRGGHQYLAEEEKTEELAHLHRDRDGAENNIESVVPRLASKPASLPPPAESLTRQSNVEPAPGAYRVAPDTSARRATASLSSESSVATAEGTLAVPPPPPPPPLPSLVEAEPVVSSVLVEASPVDGEIVPEGAAPTSSGLIPARWKCVALVLLLVSVVLVGVVVGVVIGVWIRPDTTTVAPTSTVTAMPTTAALPPTSAPPSEPTVALSSVTTAAISSKPTEIPSSAEPSTAPPTATVMAFRSSLPPYTTESLQNTSSPQYRAYEWVTEIDQVPQDVAPDNEEERLLRMMQRFALATLFNSINQTGSAKSNVSECEWPYVICTDNTRVSSLEPDGNGGTIPREIGLLTALNDLYFYDNQLTSTLPTELGLLTGLTSLYLYFNQLTSAIPTELGLLTNLRNLQLSNNQLTGTFPSDMCQFSFDAFSLDVDCSEVVCTCCPDCTT